MKIVAKGATLCVNGRFDDRDAIVARLEGAGATVVHRLSKAVDALMVFQVSFRGGFPQSLDAGCLFQRLGQLQRGEAVVVLRIQH
ncbi:MAG: hypothetical protein AAFV53_27025 [Myxococcota bacterium]